MATPTNAISKRTRERINLLPDLLKQFERFGEQLRELYDVVVAGNPKENTASLVERVRNLEDYVKDQKKFMASMRGSMAVLILKAAWDILTQY